MNITDWITLAAVLVALGIGVSSIIQTQKLQTRERKERLLNEIIEWATSIIKINPIPKENIIKFTKEEEPDINDVILIWSRSLQEIVSPIIARGAYINRISYTLGRNIEIATNNTSLCLADLVGYINKLDNKRNSIKTLMESCKKLNNAALVIMEEAVKIKCNKLKPMNNVTVNERIEEELSLIDIEKHLTKQDKQLKRGNYFAGYQFGASLIFISFGLLGGKYILTDEIWYVIYCIILLFGGTFLMGFAWYRNRKE